MSNNSLMIKCAGENCHKCQPFAIHLRKGCNQPNLLHNVNTIY